MLTSSRAPSLGTIVSAGSVEQMLKLGWKFGIAAGTLRLYGTWSCSQGSSW